MIVGGWLIFSPKPTAAWDEPEQLAHRPERHADVFRPAGRHGRPAAEDVGHFQQSAGGLCRRPTAFSRGSTASRTVRDPKQPAPFQRHHRELAFENVGFAYQPDKPVLEEINLKIAFGETIAIVGPNGCGKSTLANLIPRFADPTTGVVKLDGVPLPDMRLRDLRGQIGLVTQETMLFDDTIFNNIRYGTPHATREQVIEAAKQAHAHRFIEHELPHGYETSAGALGNCLSGGQRQRIALARAILRDPAILILDEATSQVDLESEQAIQQVLEKFTQGRTTDPHHPSAGRLVAGRSDRGDASRPDSRRRPPRGAADPLRPLPPAVSDPFRGPEADGVRTGDAGSLARGRQPRQKWLARPSLPCLSLPTFCPVGTYDSSPAVYCWEE